MARTSQSAQRATPWGWALGGALVGMLVAAALFAPARWMASAISRASAGQVLLADARGTLWNGSAALVLSGGTDSQGSVGLPGRLLWQLRPRWGGFAVQVNAPCCMAQALAVQASPRWAGLRVVVADHQSSWPAGLLVGLGTPWNTIQAQGALALSTQTLALEMAAGRWTMAGRVQLDAQDMASKLSTLKPMGSYRLVLAGGASNTLALETLQGSLLLNGNGQWVGGRLRFEGVASAAPDRLDALSNLLNIIGRRDGARAIIKVG